MRKSIFLMMTHMMILLLSGCELNMYDAFNQAVQNIEAEASGYVFFTDHYMIDGDSLVNLDDVFERLLREENIETEILYYDYHIVGDLIYAIIKYALDDDGIYQQVIVMYDFIKETLLYTELLPTYEPIRLNRVYDIFVDAHQNMLLSGTEDQALILYQREDDTIIKTVIERPFIHEQTIISIKNHVYIRYQASIDPETNTYSIIFKDAYDYIHLEEVTEEPLDHGMYEHVIEESFIKNDITYTLYHDHESLWLHQEDTLYLETTYLMLYHESEVGRYLQEILLEEDLDPEPDLSYVIITNNEIFIIYQYQMGFLMNTSVLGESYQLVFRLDIETTSLVYIGASDHVNDVYKK